MVKTWRVRVGKLGCVLFGAILVLPIGWQPWLQWQAHRARQAQLTALTQSVHDLKEDASTADPEPSAVAAPQSPQTVQASLQTLAQRSGLQLQRLELGLPFLLSAQGGWLCPFQVHALGKASQGVAWWRSVVQQQVAAVLDDSQWQAQANQPMRLSMQIHVPCALTPERNAPPMDDPFSLSQWQALHAQRAQSHPSFRALAQRWHRPRTPLERFTLEQVHYVGYMHDGRHQLALVAVHALPVDTASDQKQTQPIQSYTVELGQALGAQWGEVMRIDAQALTVQEWLRDDSGVWRSHQVVLPLEGGAPGGESP